MENNNRNFYREFEEKNYAPRVIIKEMRKVYLPFVRPLGMLYPHGKTYDLGCGRGEWLELMSSLEFEPFGVDLDEGMLVDCRERGLPVCQGDGISFIKTLPEESHIVVSAFHVIEHISLDDLKTFIKEALRILKPGGILLMETPNPENIRVATSNFYLDPTHVRPVPQLLLQFLTEFFGFKRNKLLRLQESVNILNSNDVNLINVLNDVSPDYAIIAQKDAVPEQLALFDASFEKEYGLSLISLAERYDQQLGNKFFVIEAKLQQSETTGEEKLHAIEVKLQQSEATGEEKLRAIEAKLQQSETTGEEKLRAIEAKLQQSEVSLKAVYASRSWRLTAPYRALGDLIKRTWQNLKNLLKPAVVRIMHFVLVRSALKRTALSLLRFFPGLKARLKRLFSVSLSRPSFIASTEEIGQCSGTNADQRVPETLSPHARRIYNELKSEIERRKREQA